MHAFSIVVVVAAAAVCYIYIYLQTKTMREEKKEREIQNGRLKCVIDLVCANEEAVIRLKHGIHNVYLLCSVRCISRMYRKCACKNTNYIGK